MSAIRKKWRNNRRELKTDLIKIMSPALAMAIIKTYNAFKHRSHIHKIWELLANYPDARQKYNANLIGKSLTGSDTFFEMIYFIDKSIFVKHRRKVPERLALGDATGIALSYMNGQQDNPT